MNVRYRVELSQTERTELTELLSGGKHAARRLKRAQILLAADGGASDEAIATNVGVGSSTVYRTQRRFVLGNREAALSEEPRPGANRKLSGKEEAMLVATACSSPPAGRARWTLELLSGELVRLTAHEGGLCHAGGTCWMYVGAVAEGMRKISYAGYRFPPEIIHQAIWLYLRFTLSFRDVEDLLAERGIAVSYETVRRWVNHFGPMIAAQLRKRRPKPHATWHLDEVYLKIDGRMVYLWRAVDAEGEVLDVLVQSKRDKHAALKLMRKLLKKYAFAPERLVTDDLRSYGPAASRSRHRTPA